VSPQGSALRPLLFSLCTTPIANIFTDSPIAFHLYADDTQLYISFSSPESTTSLATLSSTLDTVYSWLTLNRLTVNPAKTEYLLIPTHWHLRIGTQQQRSKIIDSSLSFQGTFIAQNHMLTTTELNSTLISHSPNTSPTSVAPPTNTSANYVQSDHLLTPSQPFFLPTPWGPQNLTIATPYFIIFHKLPLSACNVFKTL
jgi:hypothetical protein